MRFSLVALLIGLLFSAGSLAQEQIQDLDQLLESVRAQQAQQRSLNRERERDFLADKRRQQQL